MGKNARAYKSQKRKKELMRQKKQERKRQRRFGKAGDQEGGVTEGTGTPNPDGHTRGDTQTEKGEG